ncbi:DsbA family protein [Shimia sp.]|uniref:DsbA family oxidoreductase n=1 Tax=Shimia sp. TaxID=1954381 RepID=UPI00356467A6
MNQTKILHYSDLLCIWAYVSEQALYCLNEDFGERVSIEAHFCSVFPDTETKIATMWEGRGGFDGYAAHVREVAGQFDGITLHPDVWTRTRPRSSASPHLFLKAVELLESDGGLDNEPFEKRPSAMGARALRRAFFAEGRDIANWAVQREICDEIGIGFDPVLGQIESGAAIARLAADYEQARAQGIQGSPTYVLNEGRQRLFGNLGYGILHANIKELLTGGPFESTSLCS